MMDQIKPNFSGVLDLLQRRRYRLQHPRHASALSPLNDEDRWDCTAQLTVLCCEIAHTEFLLANIEPEQASDPKYGYAAVGERLRLEYAVRKAMLIGLIGTVQAMAHGAAVCLPPTAIALLDPDEIVLAEQGLDSLNDQILGVGGRVATQLGIQLSRITIKPLRERKP